MELPTIPDYQYATARFGFGLLDALQYDPLTDDADDCPTPGTPEARALLCTCGVAAGHLYDYDFSCPWHGAPFAVEGNLQPKPGAVQACAELSALCGEHFANIDPDAYVAELRAD